MNNATVIFIEYSVSIFTFIAWYISNAFVDWWVYNDGMLRVCFYAICYAFCCLLITKLSGIILKNFYLMKMCVFLSVGFYFVECEQSALIANYFFVVSYSIAFFFVFPLCKSICLPFFGCASKLMLICFGVLTGFAKWGQMGCFIDICLWYYSFIFFFHSLNILYLTYHTYTIRVNRIWWEELDLTWGVLSTVLLREAL